MTELKTLKDIRGISRSMFPLSIDEKYINYGDLKAEAVKWIKMEEREQYPLKSIWRVFFDITNEDLK